MFGNLFFLVIGLLSLFVGLKDQDLMLIVFGVITILSAISVFDFVKTGKVFGWKDKVN